MKEATVLFGALSDETRLRILALLAHGELCVCQVEAILQMPQTKVSRHLTVLRYAGLVSGRRQGVWIHYSLAQARDDLHARVVEWLRSSVQQYPQVQADVRRIADCPPVGVECCQDEADESPSTPSAKSYRTAEKTAVERGHR